MEIAGVHGRTDVLVHTGTKPQHSEGCILAGAAKKTKVRYKDSAGNDKEREVITISDDSTLRNMPRAFYGTDAPNACPNRTVRVDIKDI